MPESTDMKENEANAGKEKLGENSILIVTPQNNHELIQVADDLKTRGIHVAVKLVPPDTLKQLQSEFSRPHTREQIFPEIDGPPEKRETAENRFAQELRDEYGDLKDSVIITAEPLLRHAVSKAAASRVGVIDYYDAIHRWDVSSFEDVKKRVQPIIEEIRQRGFTPVVMQDLLGDREMLKWHFELENEQENNELNKKIINEEKEFKYIGSDELDYSPEYRQLLNLPPIDEDQLAIEDRIFRGRKYSAILRDRLGLPVIDRSEVRIKTKVDHLETGQTKVSDEYEGDINAALKTFGIQPEKAVLLVGYDFLNAFENTVGRDNLQSAIDQAGFDKIKFVVISPAFINSIGDQRLFPHFNFLPLEYEKQRRIDALMDEIELRRKAYGGETGKPAREEQQRISFLGKVRSLFKKG